VTHSVARQLSLSLCRAVPSTVLYQLNIAMNKPDRRPKDSYEAGVGPPPYRIEEVRPNSVFLVEHEGPPASEPASVSMMGINDGEWAERARLAAGLDPTDSVKQATADADALVAFSKAPKEAWLEGQTTQTMANVMAVVKLKSGGVLLFNPAVIHAGTETAAWLAEMGPVRYIVAGSSAHSVHLAEVVTQHPDAKMIGPPGTQDKLVAAGVLPRGKLDAVLATQHDALAINAELAADGVKLYPIEGDAATQAIVAVADRTALEVDILYKHRSVCGCAQCHAPSYRERPDYAIVRTLGRVLLSAPNSPAGYLPHYRYEMMDPSAAIAMFMGPYGPASDGSGTQKMAASLREFLAADFDSAISGHTKNPVPAADFRQSIDLAWRRLDGKPLAEQTARVRA
jgi:hypothetical protein